MLKDLVLKNRSYRRFYESEPVSGETLRSLIDLARTVPSTGNSQALKFRLIHTPEENAKVFSCVGWAASLPDWDGPEEGERPSAYIVVVCDQELGQNKQTDDGIVAQTILLGAAEQGLGGCMLGNVRRTELAKALGLEEPRYKIDLVIALGKPKETVRLVDVPESGDIRYYRDENKVHYVPKRALDDLIL